MQDINIEKKANGYMVTISGDFDDVDSIGYIYLTREQMQEALPEIINEAHALYEKIQADKAEAKTKKLNAEG